MNKIPVISTVVLYTSHFNITPDMSYEEQRKGVEAVCNEHGGYILSLQASDFRDGTDLNNITPHDVKLALNIIYMANVVIFRKQCLKNRYS